MPLSTVQSYQWLGTVADTCEELGVIGLSLGPVKAVLFIPSNFRGNQPLRPK